MAYQRLKLNKQTRQRFSRIRRLDQLKKMDPIEFEHFVGYLYQKQGYTVSTTVTSGDEGVDLFLRKGVRTAVVQCKRYAGTVGQPTVRDLYGAMAHTKANRAMLVTTGTISRPAEAWAVGKPIDLVDGHELISWVRQSRRSSKPSLLSLIPWRIVGIVIFLLVAYWGWATVLSPSLTQPTDQDNLILPTQEPTKAPQKPTPALITRPTDPPANLEQIGAIPLSDGFINREITIDGRLSDWPPSEKYSTPHLIFQSGDWDGSSDLATLWRFAWDKRQLYVGVDVIDDTHVQTQKGQAANQGDSLTIRLRLNDQIVRATLSPGDFATIPASVWVDGAQADEVPPPVAARQTTAGYTLEATLPWSLFGVEPQAEMMFRFVFIATDNDTPNTAVREVQYANTGSYQPNDLTTWGILILTP